MDITSISAKASSSRSHEGHGVELDNKLTQKFLRGEISFAEYSSEWYNEDVRPGANIKEEIETPDVAELLSKDFTQERRKNIRLSPALLGLMGEANLRFVRGERDVAEKMCYEIIRQVPRAPEPYQTLAQIYENDTEKSLQFSLLAAHLSPSDANEWLRLASISKMRNDPKQEMLCYTQAIKGEPHNLEMHMKRLDLLTSLENINFPINTLKITRVKCYHKIVTSIPAEQGEVVMKYMKMAASIYHSNNEIEKALEVMAAGYKKCSELFTLENTNLFLEVLIAQKQYETCIEVFVANVGVEIEAEIETVSQNEALEEKTTYIDCKIPPDLPIDLSSKLIVCFIHLSAINLVNKLIAEFLTNDVEKAGDLFIDIEEALSSVGQHVLALALLDPLVKNKNFDLGAVWLKHAECLYNLGRDDEAIESYLKVLQHAPQHLDARLKLFQVLEKKARVEEALAVLQQDYKLAVRGELLQQQVRALRRYGQPLQLLEVGEVLLSKTFFRFRSLDEARFARHSRVSFDTIYNFRTARGEKPYHDDDIHFDEDETFKLSADEEWELYKELLQIAFQHKKYYVMERLSFGAYVSKNLANRRSELDFYCIQACILNQNYSYAYQIVKELTTKYRSTLSYNILGAVAKLADDVNWYKILVRKNRKENHPSIGLLLGNALLASGRGVLAIQHFLEYHEKFKDSFSALMIAICLLTLSSMRTIKKHDNLILQGVSYLLKYGHLRQCEQEVYYNMGRAYQMLSLNNLAIEYYEKALACPPVANCPEHGFLELTKEIAFNLSLLYKDHAPLVARSIMSKYIVIE